MSDSVRDLLTTALTPLVPQDWRIIPNQAGTQTLDKVTLVFKITKFSPLPEAPMGSLSNEIIITIIDPHSDPVNAENALDESVLELVTALDGLDWLVWSEANKVLVNDAYLGWDITARVITQKER